MGALYTFYKCKDGEWLHLAVTQHDRYWKPLAEALNVPELAEDERFKKCGPDLQKQSPADPASGTSF